MVNSLQREPLAKIQPPDVFVLDQFIRLAGAEYLTFGHDVGSVGDAEGFADVVVGDEDADSLLVIFRVTRGSTFLGLAFFALSGGEAFCDVTGEVFGERSPRGCFASAYHGAAAAVVNAEDIAVSKHRTVNKSDLDVDVG